MIKPDKTFELLELLSEAEKRFVKSDLTLKSITENESKYVRMFVAMENYYANGEAPVNFMLDGKENVDEAKNKLYNLILESVSNFNSKSSQSVKLYDNLKKIEFLFNKNLFDQADKILTETKQLAKEQDLLALMPEIMRWKKKLMAVDDYEITNAELKQFCFDEVDQIDQLELVNKFWKLQASLVLCNRQACTEATGRTMENVFSERFMQLPDLQLPFRARYLKNKIYATYFYYIEDWQSCYNYLKEMMHLLENAQYQTEFYQNEYIETLRSLLSVTRKLSLTIKYDDYMNHVEQLYLKRKEYKATYLMHKIEKLFHQYNKQYEERLPKQKAMLQAMTI